MKQLTLVVRPFCAEEILRVVADLDVFSCVVREAKGFSRQKDYLSRYRGTEYGRAFLPKIEISLWVDEENAESVADELARVARTGRMGDGKIFVQSLAWGETLEF